jgi:hypothetical protein
VFWVPLNLFALPEQCEVAVGLTTVKPSLITRQYSIDNLSTKQISAAPRNDGAPRYTFCVFGVSLSNSSVQVIQGFQAN